MNPDQRETKWVIWTFIAFILIGLVSIGLFMYFYLSRL